MLEGASEMDHQIPQAYFTSMRRQAFQKVQLLNLPLAGPTPG